MFRFLQNPKVRLIVSIGASFAFGQLIFGGLRDYTSPVGVLLIVLAAMPILAFGFYLQLGAVARQLGSSDKA